MRKPKETVDKAFDRAVFGSNKPEAIEKKLDKMKQYLELEASSLGHSLAGIRHRQYWTLETVAEKAGVPIETWRSWESDMKTPSPEELATVLKKLHWSWDLQRLLVLRKAACRVQLGRLSKLSPNLVAAKGVGGISGSYEWRSLDDELKSRLEKWGADRRLTLPADLISVLASFDSDEERDSWMDEVLCPENHT